MRFSKTMKLVLAGGMVFGLLAGGTALSRAAEPNSSGLDVIKVRPDFYMIAGAGGNIGVQIGVDGVVLVDAGAEAASDQVVAEIKKLTNLPIRYIVDTGADADLVSGNAKLAKAGLTIFTNALGNTNFANAMTNGGGASILAHESVLRRMSAPTGKTAAFPVETWPTEAFYTEKKSIRMNDEPIEVIHQPAAHSDADSFVFFRKSDVIAAGDVLNMTRFPVIDTEHGGSVQGEIDALNRLIDMAVPPGPFIYEGVGTYVIPGHGRLCVQLDVVNYRDMVVIVRDNVADLIKQGKTISEIQEASPAKPFETEYGTQSGVTAQFVESIYKSLTKKK